MIFIVIDNDYVPAKVLGVYSNHTECDEYLLSLNPDPDDNVVVTTWDIVRNEEVV